MKRCILLVTLAVAACSSTNSPETATPTQGVITPTSQSAEAVARFQDGMQLLDNLRTTEANQQFAEALRLDPDFVLAAAFHGSSTPGADGLKEMEAAEARSVSLTEGERLLIQAMVANRKGENARTTEVLNRLVAVAPQDPTAHYYLGNRLLNDQRYAEAVPALRRAVELNPKAGGAQNMLGYAALRQGDAEGAIAAFTAYTQMLPDEPNAQDSLGEAFLAAGRFPESEAAFRKAAEISPAFWNAWEGLAYVKFYAGDVTAGREALARANDAATRRVDRIAVSDLLALSHLVSGNAAEALKTLDASERMAGVQPAEVAGVPLRRAMIQLETGQPREAIATVDGLLQQISGGTLTPSQARNLRREALRIKITAEARLSDAAAATTTSAALDREAESRPDDLTTQNAMHYGRGLLAMARGDAAGARDELARCTADDDICRWQRVLAMERARDAGAAAARQELTKMYVRDPGHLYVRSKVSPPAKRTTE